MFHDCYIFLWITFVYTDDEQHPNIYSLMHNIFSFLFCFVLLGTTTTAHDFWHTVFFGFCLFHCWCYIWILLLFSLIWSYPLSSSSSSSWIVMISDRLVKAIHLNHHLLNIFIQQSQIQIWTICGFFCLLLWFENKCHNHRHHHQRPTTWDTIK